MHYFLRSNKFSSKWLFISISLATKIENVMLWWISLWVSAKLPFKINVSFKLVWQLNYKVLKKQKVHVCLQIHCSKYDVKTSCCNRHLKCWKNNSMPISRYGLYVQLVLIRYVLVGNGMNHSLKIELRFMHLRKIAKACVGV